MQDLSAGLITAEEAKDTLNVAIVIESEVVRTGMETVLRKLPDVRTVRALPLDAASMAVAAEDYDVLIVAAEQWGLLGEFDERQRDGLPPVLVLGDDLYDRNGADFASLPADGFLPLDSLSARALENALQRLAMGEVPMPASLAKRLLMSNRSRRRDAEPVTIPLTPRETETLLLLADGLSNKQVARCLGISAHGAKRLVGSILLKLGAPNRTAAVITALRIGLL
ncbi:Response regulator protein VraR [Streptomyces fradiae ATCC 10745 = DSM 40063]|uniref:Response regulator protein VraR n=2 Tax=Streptomyces TaxID=1883 RepID=A0A1Y2NS82_STRFR|nr:Response regulator protein VraR [Streptomyces fradiae ATCC 10745 = DSM 40063]